ncbi:MAG: type II toxin-antitoxin system PemK/MazF family toxin [Anaerolineales bacterium]|nr:MAG: type II toxin-antitoxin system PemK/MazF family toxin [Anaerolineales bacterium]
MTFRRGDVVLVPFPFSDLSTTKVRPAVVVSGALYHATEPDLLLAALTSKVAAATGPLDYSLDDWRATGLRHPSALKPVLFTLDPVRVIYRVGALAPADLAQVDQRLRRALEL